MKWPNRTAMVLGYGLMAVIAREVGIVIKAKFTKLQPGPRL